MPTVGAFTDTARFVTEFSIKEAESGTKLVAFSHADGRILASDGSSFALYNGNGWTPVTTPVGILTSITKLASCDGTFIGTNGTDWVRYINGGFTSETFHFQRGEPSLLLGSDTCLAFFGSAWVYRTVDKGWIEPSGDRDRIPNAPTLGSQSGTQTLVYDGTSQYLLSAEPYSSWYVVTGLPKNPDLIAENKLIHAENGWFLVENLDPNTTNTPTPFDALNGAHLGTPLAAGQVADGVWVVTDGRTWVKAVEGSDEATSFRGPEYP